MRALLSTLIATIGVVVAATVSPAGATMPAPASITPTRTCASMAGLDVSRVPDAPSRIASTAVVTDRIGTKNLAFCDVKGVTAPRTHFEIKLPVSTWRGRYVQEGCQSYCGSVQRALTDPPLAGYVCKAADDGTLVLSGDDEGHTSADATDGSWAKDDPVLRVVFGLTSEHSLAQVAKAVIAGYYGRAPTYSYFDGCSTGGREALILAQRYPTDFDGIIAGAPASNLAPLGIEAAWLARSNTDAAGHQILTAEKLPALHAAVMARCANSAGLITDPRRCGFDPASLRCPPGKDNDGCLTPAQVGAVRAFYRGPTDRRGRSLFNGGEPYGSELAWQGQFVQPADDAAAPGDTLSAELALNYLEYMGFVHNPPADFTLADVRFTDSLFHRLNRLGSAIYNANNPDLRAFAAHGGKLIVYHGWADQAISPWSTLDYYGAVERASGGFAASQTFSRLYMVPGGNHCLFGADGSINLADFLTPVMSWVEHGTAPRGVPAEVLTPAGAITMAQTLHPVDALARVRPAPGSLNGHYDYIGSYPDPTVR